MADPRGPAGFDQPTNVRERLHRNRPIVFWSSPTMPQVLALARRAFAGGHADLRPGFFRTDDAQRLTIARLERQSVPLILLLDTDGSLQQFFVAFPLIKAYVDEQYQLTATHVFDGRFGISLFSRRDLQPVSTWQPLDWPCYR